MTRHRTPDASRAPRLHRIEYDSTANEVRLIGAEGK